jgi:ATP-dependent Clp protease ATP-binding subunit ClpC
MMIIKKVIIGQDEAITKITKAIQRNRLGLKDPSNRSVLSYSSAQQVSVKQN